MAVIQKAWIGGISTRRADELAQAMGLSDISGKRYGWIRVWQALITDSPGSTSASVHYTRGQILLRLGRRDDAQSELDTASRIQKQTRDELERVVSGEQVPSPELAAEPK